MSQKQHGAALVISLILLTLITIIGLSAMRSGVMQQKMATNERDAELAFQATETVLRDAENWLSSQLVEPLATANGSTNVWELNAMDPNDGNPQSWWQERDQTWWNNTGVSYGVALDNINTPPLSIIEYQYFKSDDLIIGDGGPPNGTSYYRITGQGTGGSDFARSLLQSTLAKRY
jgi:type IV pilus assembly protein PilX